MALADGVRRLREALDTQLPQMHAALQERRAAAQGARLAAADADAAVERRAAELRALSDALVLEYRAEGDAADSGPVAGAVGAWGDVANTTSWNAAHTFVMQAKDVEDAFDRLDVVLALQLRGVVDASLPHTALHDLLERAPVGECASLFDYTESRTEALTRDMSPTKGKGLVMLRLCNELLRRLSKDYKPHMVFSGRILTLLSAVFPVNERSGVNLKGDFHEENAWTIDVVDAGGHAMDEDKPEAEGDAQKGATPPAAQLVRDPQFYQLFWGLQRYFANPLLLFAQTGEAPGSAAAQALHLDDPQPTDTSASMAVFRMATRCTLDVFAHLAPPRVKGARKPPGSGGKAAPEATEPAGQALPSATAEPARKRARTEKVKDGADADADTYYPKYLTGRPLLEYELEDTMFRRHVLVQFLVVLQFLLGLSKASKERWSSWTNKLLMLPHTLREGDERWVRATWREIQAQLRDSWPDGRVFLDTVLDALKRDDHWLQWKGAGAPAVEKPPVSEEQREAQASAVLSTFAFSVSQYPHALGTAPLSELWSEGLLIPPPSTRKTEDEDGGEIEVPTDGFEELEFPPPVPSLASLSRSVHVEEQRLKQQLARHGDDPAAAQDPAVLAAQETKQSLAWRALRCAGKERLHLFSQMGGVDNIPGLLRAIDSEDKGVPFEAAELDEREETPEEFRAKVQAKEPHAEGMDIGAASKGDASKPAEGASDQAAGEPAKEARSRETGVGEGATNADEQSTAAELPSEASEAAQQDGEAGDETVYVDAEHGDEEPAGAGEPPAGEGESTPAGTESTPAGTGESTPAETGATSADTDDESADDAEAATPADEPDENEDEATPDTA